jgi:hypothetical protein
VSISNNGVLRGWTENDAEQLRIAVRNTALALGIKANGSPILAFRRVMRRSFDPYPFIVLQKNSVAAGGKGYPYCITDNNATTTTITCYFDSAINEHVIVHELGHVFNNRSDQNGNTSLTEYVNRTENGPALIDSKLRVVMGKTDTVGSIWQRGTRGWGTGPNNDVSTFQQHPDEGPFASDSIGTKMDETAADMFLNWVYRIADPELPLNSPNTIIGFRNISWMRDADSEISTTANQCYVPAGCPDNRNPGDARFNWMNNPNDGKMTLIFNSHGWNN